MYTFTVFCALSVTTPGATPSSSSIEDPHEISDPLPEGAIRRLGVFPYHMPNPVATAALSQDGTTLAVVDRRGVVIIMDAASGKIRQRAGSTQFAYPNVAIEFLSDRNRFILTSQRRVPQPHRINYYWQFWNLQGHGAGSRIMAVEESATSRDGRILVMGGSRLNSPTQLRIEDLTSGQTLPWLKTPHTGPIHLAMTPNGKLFATGEKHIPGKVAKRARGDQIVCIWELPEAKEARQIKVRKGNLIEMAFAPDNKTLAISDSQGGMEIWDATTGNRLHHWKTKVIPRGFLRFSPDGTKLVGAPVEEGVTVWDARTGKVLAECDTDGLRVTGVGFRKDGTILACTPQDHMVHVWDVTANKRLTPEPMMVAPADALAFSRDGKSLVSVHKVLHLRHWDLSTGEFRHITPKGDIWPDEMKAGGYAVGVGLSPRGEYFAVACAGEHGKLLVFNAATGDLVRTFKTRVGSVGQVAFSGDETQLCVIPNPSRWKQGMEGAAEVWNLKSEQSVKLEDVPYESLGISFSTAGNRIAIAARVVNRGNLEGEIGVWDPSTGQRLLRLKGASVGRRNQLIEWTPDGRHLIYVDDSHRTVVMKESTTGRLIQQFDRAIRETTSDGRLIQRLNRGPGALPYSSMAVSPDGRTVALSSLEKLNWHGNGDKNVAIRVYELASGRLRQRFEGHPRDIRWLAYSPDGRMLASEGYDPTILLWDTSLPEPEKTGLTAKEASEIWDRLFEKDGQAAAKMIGRLVVNPDVALALLTKELQPIPKPGIDLEQVQRWIAELGAARFAVREKAYVELYKRGIKIDKQLREALKRKPNAEARRRLEQLIQQLKPDELTPLDILHIRAVEVLEHIGTDAAQQLLRRLAKGDPQAILTQEAIATLKRMEDGE